MSRPLPRTVPLGPVRPFLRVVAADLSAASRDVAALGRLLELGVRQAQRFHAADTIPDYHAETVAAALGMHPLNLWPELAD